MTFTAVALPLVSVSASAIEIPIPEVPRFASPYMPPEPQNLGEGIRYILGQAGSFLRPDLKEASGVCLGIVCVVMILAVMRCIPGASARVVDLAGAVSLSVLMFSSAGSLVNLASETVRQISEYGKLLLTAMTAALAAQGGITKSAALYTATAVFDGILCSLISSLLIPLVYVFLAVSVVGAAIGEDMLKKCRDGIKWLTTWSLKTLLYIFTGYIGLTGVISGTTDAASLKAAKLTIAGVVPVVGGILSDASEAVLVGAAAIKNAAGLYGFFAVCAICIGPFVKIGVHYLMLRITAILCSIFAGKTQSELIQDFAGAMGMLLGMTGAVSMMFLISLICYMRGVG